MVNSSIYEQAIPSEADKIKAMPIPSRTKAMILFP